MKIFCLSIYNKNFEQLKNLNLIPVGLSNTSFDTKWLSDKGKDNISEKNPNFGEYTFHYNLWKNNLLEKDYNDWIGFCSYRRFWTKNVSNDLKSYDHLNEVIVKKKKPDWDNFEVVLGEPLIFNKIKNIKLIKRNIFEVIKNPKVLFKKNNLIDQFRIFHGSFFLEKALDLLSSNNKENFLKFLNGYQLNPYNMFICKNTKILNEFYEEVFPWLFECEEAFKDENLDGYEKQRIYGFLAERYMPYWFKKNFKTTTCQISFLEMNDHK
tara:strand:+ start:56 stop:856 length:801 start_codon:yes stop_codon:yes gene_type:complete